MTHAVGGGVVAIRRVVVLVIAVEWPLTGSGGHVVAIIVVVFDASDPGRR